MKFWYLAQKTWYQHKYSRKCAPQRENGREILDIMILKMDKTLKNWDMQMTGPNAGSKWTTALLDFIVRVY